MFQGEVAESPGRFLRFPEDRTAELWPFLKIQRYGAVSKDPKIHPEMRAHSRFKLWRSKDTRGAAVSIQPEVREAGPGQDL